MSASLAAATSRNTVMPFAQNRCGNLAAISPDAGGGQYEITQIATTDDVAGSLHGKYFLISDASGRVSMTMDGGALTEMTSIDVTGVDATSLSTGDVGKYFLLSLPSGTVCFWFYVGQETAPSVSATTFIQVNVSPGDSDAIVSSILRLRMVDAGFADVGGTDPTFNVTAPTGAVAAPPSSGTSGIALTVQESGQNAAANPGVAARNIMLNVMATTLAADVAIVIRDAANLDGAWTATSSTDIATLTDVSNGARLDAAAGTSGFTISIIQQGV